MYVIKAIYPSGGHIVMFEGERLRFEDRQEATHRAEVLNSTTRDMAARSMRVSDTTYIVVEESL